MLERKRVLPSEKLIKINKKVGGAKGEKRIYFIGQFIW
jgi:hypothetical protein